MRFPFEIDRTKVLDVVGFGTNAVDFLIQVPEYPKFNSKIELSSYLQAPGGEAATTVAGLTRLGLRTAYIGRFGDDAAGRIGLQSLEAEGVDLSFAETVPGVATQIAFIIIDERSGERTVIWQREAGLSYTRDDAPLAAAATGKVLHFTPHDVEACIAMAAAAKQTGTIVSIDVDNIFQGIEELLSLVDILITSADFLPKFTGIADHENALAAIQERFGSGVAGVTLGEKGSLLRAGGNFVRTDGMAVPGGCKDTTGAGDSFRVGLLYGLLTDMTVEDAARAANAVAALKCRALGARTALPNASELLEFLQ
ncbi:MAG: carbohydrate kinase family protein [Acidobacteria bacterium]|nr:carbohydrate kinase family protein [Acidobacteriota bacterium]